MARDPDVLIVGAGPSGAVAAKRLAEDGFRVTVLEQGDWADYSKARPEAADFDITATRDWTWDPNARNSAADYPIDDSESDITALMWNGVGGGTIVYAAQWQRNMPSDFRVRSLDGIADDWPLTYEELEPYYVRVEKDFGISGVANDTAFPPGEGPPLPAVPLGPAGRKVAAAHNELGWHWWPAPNAIATRKYRNLNPCVQRGVCLKACRDHAKGSVDITHWPVAQRAGVELVTKATVREITVGRDGLASGVVYVDDAGAEHRIGASVVILAANGIGTPRLLLLSGGDEGLANSSGMVGRRLMMHPFGTVVGLFEDDLGSTQGPWGQHLHSLEFYESDASPEASRLALSVTRTDAELVQLMARTRKALVDWQAEVLYSGPDGDGSVIVNDDGAPFRVSTEIGSTAYKYEGQGKARREPFWDRGIRVC